MLYLHFLNKPESVLEIVSCVTMKKLFYSFQVKSSISLFTHLYNGQLNEELLRKNTEQLNSPLNS